LIGNQQSRDEPVVFVVVVDSLRSAVGRLVRSVGLSMHYKVVPTP
jgi:hypothetical protein